MSARSDGIEALTLPEMERRLANTVRYGKISAVDHAARRVRVQSGDIETTWLPWSAGRAAAGKRRWDAPEIGEQVVMLAPTGDLRQAMVMPGVYQDAYDAPSSDPNVDKVEYGDGTTIEYNRDTHTLVADLDGSRLSMNRNEILLTIGTTTLQMTAGGCVLTTSDFDVNCPLSTFSGIISCAGFVMTGAGGGTAMINGNITTTGTITNNGKDIGSTHTHAGSPSAPPGAVTPTGTPN